MSVGAVSVAYSCSKLSLINQPNVMLLEFILSTKNERARARLHCNVIDFPSFSEKLLKEGSMDDRVALACIIFYLDTVPSRVIIASESRLKMTSIVECAR